MPNTAYAKWDWLRTCLRRHEEAAGRRLGLGDGVGLLGERSVHGCGGGSSN
jgi:hypothetical protein